MSSFLSREAILHAPDRAPVEVEVPEWGGTVRVRGMSGTDRDAFEASIVEERGDKRVVTYDNLRAKLVARVLVDEAGKRLFTDADIAALGERSAAVLDRLYTVGKTLSGIGEQDEAEMLEGLKKARSNGLRSGSLSLSTAPAPNSSSAPVHRK